MSGLGRPSGQAVLVAVWYTGLTAVVLVFAYRDRGIGRAAGILVIAAYLVFGGSLLAAAYLPSHPYRVAVPAAAALAVVFGVRLAAARQDRAPDPRRTGRQPVPRVRGPGRLRRAAAAESLLSGWPARRLWILGPTVSLIVAAADAALGARVVLIGLLITGPCCVLLTGRWVPTGLTGLWVTGLAVMLGIPDGIWGTGTHVVFLAAVAGAAAACTVAAARITARRPPGPR